MASGEISSELELLREAQDRRLEAEGIPMVLTLVSEAGSVPTVTDPAVVADGARLADRLDAFREALVPSSLDTDMGCLITTLVVTSYSGTSDATRRGCDKYPHLRGPPGRYRGRAVHPGRELSQHAPCQACCARRRTRVVLQTVRQHRRKGAGHVLRHRAMVRPAPRFPAGVLRGLPEQRRGRGTGLRRTRPHGLVHGLHRLRRLPGGNRRPTRDRTSSGWSRKTWPVPASGWQ